MSGGMQTKVLDALSTEVAKVNERRNVRLEFIHQPAHANTGMVLVQSGFTTLVAVKYAFMDTYCELRMTVPDKPEALAIADLPRHELQPTYGVWDDKIRANGQRSLKAGYIQYVTEGDRLVTIIALFRKFVEVSL